MRFVRVVCELSSMYLLIVLFVCGLCEGRCMTDRMLLSCAGAGSACYVALCC